MTNKKYIGKYYKFLELESVFNECFFSKLKMNIYKTPVFVVIDESTLLPMYKFPPKKRKCNISLIRNDNEKFSYKYLIKLEYSKKISYTESITINTPSQFFLGEEGNKITTVGNIDYSDKYTTFKNNGKSSKLYNNIIINGVN